MIFRLIYKIRFFVIDILNREKFYALRIIDMYGIITEHVENECNNLFSIF